MPLTEHGCRGKFPAAPVPILSDLLYLPVFCPIIIKLRVIKLKATLRRIGTFFRKPQNIILVIFTVVLLYLVVYPLFHILQDTVIVHRAEVNRVKQPAGTFTWYHWEKAFGGADTYKTFVLPLINSVLCAVFSCLIAIVVGGIFAYLVIRTDMKGKKFCSSLFMLLYIMPGWTLAIAWTNFFKNQTIGGAKGLFEAVTGLATADWFAYGLFPVVLVTGLHYAPYAYILIGAILRNMDSNLEEAAMIMKARRSRIFWKVTLPLVRPAVLSTILLVFASGLSVFSTAQFLGLPVGFYTLATRMYGYLNSTNPGRGYVYTAVMMALSMGIMLINLKLMGTRKSYTTVSGKSSNISLTRLRGFRIPVSVITVLFTVSVTILPFVSFALESLTKAKGDYSPANFTLLYWIGENDGIGNAGVLRNETFWASLKTTLLLALCCSLCAGTAGCLAGYAMARKRGTKLSNLVNALTFLPYLVPSIALSAIYLGMFSQPLGPIPALYGTFLLLVIIGTVKYLPMASRAGLNSMYQISATLEESAQIMGAPWYKRMLRILVPLQKTSLLSGYLLPFISCTREMELFVMLYTPKTTLLTTLLFMYNQKGYDQFANAITLIIVIIVVIFNAVINKLTGASIDSGIGG